MALPCRLTRHAADDIDPSFSADGSRIAFQSSRDGGGIYVIPTLGGEERLVAARGFSPRFSPDGKWIAYGVAEQGGGRIYVAPAAGGPATPVAAGLLSGTGARLVTRRPSSAVLGTTRPRRADRKQHRLVRRGGPRRLAASRLHARSVLLREGFQAFHGLPFPDAWVGAGNRILFHGHVGDSSNMWQVAHSRRDVARHRRAAARDIRHHRGSRSLGDLRRAHGVHQPNDGSRYLEPADRRRIAAKSTGRCRRVTQDAADDYDPTLSDDGARWCSVRGEPAGSPWC